MGIGRRISGDRGRSTGFSPSKFILNREGCPVYKGTFLSEESFRNYEYIIDVQHRKGDYYDDVYNYFILFF